MKSYTGSKLCVLAALLVLPFWVFGDTKTYTPDTGNAIANPERGFHNRYEIVNDPSVNDYASSATSIAGFNPDMLDRTFARAKAAGNTIIHSYIHLDKYKNVDLPPALLNNLASGLAAIRTAGLKIILRPAYAWSDSPSVPETQIMRHIDQLNAVISANADVVMAMEAGWLGPWGEWHDALYCAFSDANEAPVRYRIVKHILDTTPDYIPVAVRYPIFIKEIFYMMDHNLVPAVTFMTQAQKDRIGFHNDAFLADSADCGTYDNPSWMDGNHYYTIAEKRQWMYDRVTSQGFNTFMGGESMDSSGNNDAAGVNLQSEMTLLNTTELNEDYAAVNTNIWKAANLAASGNDPAETAFQRIKRKMGYRIALLTATLPSSVIAGQSFTLSGSLRNDGYAGLIKPRTLYVVFDNGTKRYNVALNGVDTRSWLSGNITLAPQTVTLPSDMPGGNYAVALWLPDPNAALQSRSEYSVRFANAAGVWDAAKGYNVLSANMAVAPGTPVVPSTPANLSGSQSGTSVVLSWDSSAWATSYSVQKSTLAASGFSAIATGLTATGYTDTAVSTGSTYYYKVIATGSLGSSAPSNAVAVNVVADPIAPTVPQNLTATSFGLTSIGISWSASSDNVGVAGYRVFRNGTLFAIVSATSCTDVGLASNTAYSYTVKATDVAGNESAASQTLTVSTADPNPGIVLNDFSTDAFPGTNQFGGWSSGSGATIQGGELKIQYPNPTNWVGLPANNRDVSQNPILAIKIRGQNGGEQGDFQLSIGNVTKTFSQFTATAITSSSNEILIDLAANGVTGLNALGNFTINFWGASGNSGTVYISKIRFIKAAPTASPGPSASPTPVPSPTSSPSAAPSPSPTAVPSPSPSVTPSPAPSPSPSPVPSSSPSPSPSAAPSSGLLLDDFNGSPAWPGSNDLSKWAGANGFINDAGTIQSGALVLQYNNSGWFGSDVNQDLSAYKYMILRIKGSAGGEQNAFKIRLGNAYKLLNEFTSTPITTAYQNIKIDMAANGVNRSAPGQLNFEFWFGKSGSLSIEEIRFSNDDPDTQAPSVPASLALVSKSSNTVSISWAASSDNVGVSGYEVYRNGTKVGSPQTAAYSDAGLSASTTYSYTVVARDAAGNASAASSALAVTTNAPDTAAPSVPAGLSSSNLSDRAVTLSWNASTDNVSVAYYQIFRGGAQINIATGTSYTDTGLAAQTTYAYTVKAVDSSGNVSAASTALSVTTLVTTVDPFDDKVPVPAGIPAYYHSPAADPNLPAHSLSEAPAPVLNPLKGILYWWFKNDNPNQKPTPFSMEWHYFGLGDLMTGTDSYNWEPMEEFLDQVAAHGRQAALRISTNISFGGKDIPTFLQDLPLTDGNLPYDNPRVVSAFTNFIRAFGAKYDGDPRIGFITMGLVGKWGEWHTWPYEGGDNGNPNLMPTLATIEAVINAFDGAFKVTPLEIRHPRVAGTLLGTLGRIGFHDDSFSYKEPDPLIDSTNRSMTLPRSMGGKTDAIVTQELVYGMENRWLTGSIGGEVRPEVQGMFVDPASSIKDDPVNDIEIAHATWMMLNQASWPVSNTQAMSVLARFGYNLVIRNSYFKSTNSGSMKVGIRIENNGVAPFYYDQTKWPVVVGLKDASGKVWGNWEMNWNLKKVKPSKIRVLPDWESRTTDFPAPKYMDLADPYYFDQTVSLSGIPAGSYTLLLRVKNPLETIPQSDLADHNDFSWQSYTKPLPLLFANQEQQSDGWVNLGPVTVQ